MGTTTAVLIISLFAYAVAVKPLKSWKLCKRSDPKMEDCLKSAVESAVRGLKNGNHKLGVLPLDPLHLDHLQIKQATGPVSVNLEFHNIDIGGIGALRVDSFKADWDKLHLEAETHLENPHSLNVTGQYKIDGKILMLPIQGSGPCDLLLENFKSRIIFDGQPMENNGETYVDFKQVKVIIDTSKLHVKLENLFNGDKALGDNMNVFLNENWSDILEELKPGISKAFGAAFSVVTNAIFHKISLNTIAPP